MKTFFKFSIIIACIIFSFCRNPSSSEENERFAIYLLKNDSLTTKDVEKAELHKLKLKDKPIISFNDLMSYNAENHQVYLHEKLSTYIGSNYLTLFSEYFGKPFILIANSERIYLGSFHPSLSSWLPNTPIVGDFSVDNEEKSFIISGAPHSDNSTFVDVRNDKRIFQALSSKLIK